MAMGHQDTPPAASPGGVAFPVVGIGASAGGYQALMTLLEHMQPNPGMALVVILHLAADEPSAADRVLQRATAMPVVQVTHTTPILPDHVYVIPPDRSLRMEDGHLVLDELDRSRLGRIGPVTADIFLRTLAEVHREHAIGIVLSGMGGDGTAGLACIKEMGGVTIAQLPSDAEHGSMPRSAIASGMADFVLAAAEIPRKLAELRDISGLLRRQAAHGHALDGVPLDLGPYPDVALGDVLAVLRERTGHDFAHYRRPSLLRGLERRLQVRGVSDLAGYHQLLCGDAVEVQALRKDLLIGVTGFYRDREAFDALQRLVLPGLMAPGRAPPRAWVAACSSGEEAYTLAMLLADADAGETVDEAAAAAGGRGWQIFASDIDEHAIEVARAGLYPAAIAEAIPALQLERYFTREAEQYKVRKTLRDHVLFTRHNLLQEPAFSRLDLISCRNLLIYLNRDMHRHLLQLFHFALNPGGCLLLGSAESVEAAPDLFAPVDAARRIFRARPLPGVTRAGGAERIAAPGVRPPPFAATPLPGSRPAVQAPSARRGRLFSFAEIHLNKAAELAPPSILIDAAADIVHISEQAARFLHQGGGEPTRELVALVQPALRLALRVALFQARKSGRQAGTGPVRYQENDVVHAVDIQVLPFRDPHAEGELMLVQFLPVADAVPALEQASAPPSVPPSAQEHVMLRELDEALRHTRKQLQDTIEQAEVTGTEMRIYGEEMQTTVEQLHADAATLEQSRDQLLAANMALQVDNQEWQQRAEASTKAHDDLAIEQAEVTGTEMRIYGEEMQTTVEQLHADAATLEQSRDQLLAANMALQVDNQEWQQRAEASTKAHDDLANLVASSGVATIFLDRGMRILRFTPRIADFFNVLPADIGRPLLHITNHLDCPGLAEEAATVFVTLQPMEREVRSNDGRDYIVRVHPYRTTADRIEGAVMSFFDITARKLAEDIRQAAEARMSTMFDSLPVAVCVMDADGTMVLSNRIMQRYLPTGIMPSRDPERGGRWRAWHEDGRPLAFGEFPGARALRGERVVPGIEMLYLQDDGREIWTQVASAPVSDAAGRRSSEATVVITDIDALKRTEAMARGNEGRLHGLIADLALAVWEADADGMVVADSPSWRAYTGQSVAQWLGEDWLDAVHPDDREEAARQWRAAVARQGVVAAEFRLRRPDGGWRRTRVRAEPMFAVDGSVRKWVGLNVDVDVDMDDDERAMQGSR